MQTSARIELLIEEMTIEEKIGQLGVFADLIRPFADDVNPEANRQNAHEIMEQVRAARVGTLFNGVGVELGRKIQKVAIEESRLGIPVIFAADVIHGMQTVFPIPLGETASFEPELALRTARAAAIEATARGIHWTFAPVIDVCRDQRWGRVAETSGEDTFVNSVFGQARIDGFQGEDLRRDDALLATCKHFAGYGAVSAGLEYNTVDLSLQTLRDVHLAPFKAAIDIGALAVMSAFNDINGVPASANYDLLTGILRNEWKFAGVVISDYTADMELIAHGFAEDESDATQKAFLAGLDLSMQSGFYARHLPKLIKDGLVSLDTVNNSVRRILSLKEAIGLFDNPYRSLEHTKEADTWYLPAHEALARDVSRRSIVLLKNDDDILPLSKNGQKIALIGPFARDRDNIEGCWTLFGDKQRYVTLESGFLSALDPQYLIVEAGCDLEFPIKDGINAACRAAHQADIVVLALGEPQRYSGEAQSRTDITFPQAQIDLAEAIAATGKPMVIIVRNGRALTLPPVLKNASALLITWFLGSQTGVAITDVVFGDYSPSGRLPISFSHVTGQQPYFYNHPRTGRPELANMAEYKARWREFSHEPLFPFGFGLTYTQFAYSKPQLSAHYIGWDEALRIKTIISNTGKRFGEEVVQLYIHDRVASRVRPVRELKAFRKIGLNPGEQIDLEFVIDRHALAFTNTQGKYGAEPGSFDLWVCSHSKSGDPVQFTLKAANVSALET